jgi:multiple antibiotic resistance protein
MTLNDIVLVALALLAMFSPPTTIGPAAAILASAPTAIQRRVAWLVARNYAIVMVVVLVMGSAILKGLGIATDSLTLTGGVALVHQGWPLMTRGAKAEQPATPGPVGGPVADNAPNWDSVAAVPLTFPIAIGGGTVAVVLAAAGRYPTLPDLLVLVSISLAMAMAVATTFLLVEPISQRLQNGAKDVLVRVSGIILFALGAQLAAEGGARLVRPYFTAAPPVAAAPGTPAITASLAPSAPD